MALFGVWPPSPDSSKSAQPSSGVEVAHTTPSEWFRVSRNMQLQHISAFYMTVCVMSDLCLVGIVCPPI